MTQFDTVVEVQTDAKVHRHEGDQALRHDLANHGVDTVAKELNARRATGIGAIVPLVGKRFPHAVAGVDGIAESVELSKDGP